jgi:NAD(P)-dependent dehydrogenase (short-subunit alcohol dehydrogenase family)
MNLEGKTVVITGASRGIGAGLARDFHDRGINLALCARGESALPDGERVITSQLDVTDSDAVEAFTSRAEETFGRIDLWINNAGVLDPIAPLRDIDTQEYRRHIEINVVGVFNGTRAYVRHLRRVGEPGVLLNLSSGAARNGYAGWSAYCASKAAVDLMTESVALEESGIGLRAHAVAPGVIDTKMQEQIRACSKERFPMVDKFLEMKATDSFSSIGHVAKEMLALAFDPARADEPVRTSLPAEA